jgi:hypothetical protein
MTGGYVAGLGCATLSGFRLWHLEFVQESVHQSHGLVVAARGAEPLLEDQRAPDRGDDDRQRGRREIVGVQVVLADDEVQRGDLLFAPAFGPRRDLRTDLLAVVGKSHELQQQPGVLRRGQGLPERVQRPVGGQRLLLVGPGRSAAPIGERPPGTARPWWGSSSAPGPVSPRLCAATRREVAAA